MFGTTHKVNNLIIQGSFGQGIPVDANSPKRKRTRRSFISVEREDGNVYQYRKRIGPESMEFPTNDAHELVLDECNEHNFFWALMRFKDVEKRIPSWTGFQILMQNQTPVLTTCVGYLDCINAPAAEISTIYQVNITAQWYINIFSTHGELY